MLVTDGRATSGGVDPLAEAKLAAARLAEVGVSTLVVDAETAPRLGLALELAELLRADCIPLADVTAGDGALATRIRAATRP